MVEHVYDVHVSQKKITKIKLTLLFLVRNLALASKK